MKLKNCELLEHLPEHSVGCPVCQKQFVAKFAKFGHSNYQLVSCDQCANLLAVSDLDPVVMYLELKYADKPQDFHNAVSRAAMSCKCGGKFRLFDDRRHCPHCKSSFKEIQLLAQAPTMGPEMRPISSEAVLCKPG